MYTVIDLDPCQVLGVFKSQEEFELNKQSWTVEPDDVLFIPTDLASLPLSQLVTFYNQLQPTEETKIRKFRDKTVAIQRINKLISSLPHQPVVEQQTRKYEENSMKYLVDAKNMKFLRKGENAEHLGHFALVHTDLEDFIVVEEPEDLKPFKVKELRALHASLGPAAPMKSAVSKEDAAKLVLAAVQEADIPLLEETEVPTLMEVAEAEDKAREKADAAAEAKKGERGRKSQVPEEEFLSDLKEGAFVADLAKKYASDMDEKEGNLYIRSIIERYRSKGTNIVRGDEPKKFIFMEGEYKGKGKRGTQPESEVA